MFSVIFKTSLITLILFASNPLFATQDGGSVIKFAVVSPAPASRLHNIWTPFIEHLSKQLGTQIELVIPRGFKNIEQSIRNKNIDAIYINSYAFLLFKQKNILNPIAQMQNINGLTTSEGRILVRSDSKLKSIKDLQGKKVSLISPLGAGSYLAPKAYFEKNGMEIGKDINVEYSKDLKKSVYSVLLGEASAAVMCGVNYNILTKKLNMKELSILDSTDKFPEAVIAVNASISPAISKKLKNHIINMKESEQGRKALSMLNNIKIESFIEYDVNIENITKRLMKQAKL